MNAIVLVALKRPYTFVVPAISTMLYEDGLDNYLSVSVAQLQALAEQLSEVQIRRLRRQVISSGLE
jgi:hypothetical protein